MAIILILGIGLVVIAPLFRRYHIAPTVLAIGASTVAVLAIIGLAYADPRIGQAAIDANRRFYRLVLACELPVLVLALISHRHFKWTFWLAWAINLAFALWLIAIVIWLKFFWHW